MSRQSFKIRTSAVLVAQSSAPSSPENGELYYDSTLNAVGIYQSGSWAYTYALTSSQSQLSLTNNNTAILSLASQGGARTYTIPDAGASASFVMTAGTQSIGGAKTFTTDVTTTGGFVRSNSGFTQTITSAALSANRVLSFPDSNGTNGYFLKTDGSGNLSWASSTYSIGTIDSQTKSANGAVISSLSLVMQTADATYPGLISTGTQTIAGAKTFSSSVTTDGSFVRSNGGFTLTITSAALTGNRVISFPDSDGASGYFLKTDGAGNLSWDSVSGSGVTTVGTIDSQAKSANGAVISGSSIYLQTADATNPGLVSTGTQSIAGAKTFSSSVTTSGSFVLSNGGFTQTISTAALTASRILNFPDSDGVGGYVLSTDGSGNLSWVAQGGGGTPKKDTFTLSATDITNQYIDLSYVALTDSIDFQFGVTVQREGVDYTVSYTGGAGGVTRITFANGLATGGVSALVAGDVVVIKYFH